MKKTLRALGRLGVLVAVGSALAASDIYHPCWDSEGLGERLTYDVASDCGPPGQVVLAREAYIPRRCGSPLVEATGAAELGLPWSGELIDPPPGSGAEGSRGIEAGDFYLAGPVDLPGAAPPLTVDRVCRFTPREGGMLEMICIGPAVEARCTGTLTRAVEAP